MGLWADEYEICQYLLSNNNIYHELSPKNTIYGQTLAELTSNDFSWEWFNKVDEFHFKKLQGGQLVRVKIGGLPLVEMLEGVEFLEKTVLRFKFKRADDDTHNIIIHKGSILRFRW